MEEPLGAIEIGNLRNQFLPQFGLLAPILGMDVLRDRRHGLELETGVRFEIGADVRPQQVALDLGLDLVVQLLDDIVDETIDVSARKELLDILEDALFLRPRDGTDTGGDSIVDRRIEEPDIGARSGAELRQIRIRNFVERC